MKAETNNDNGNTDNNINTNDNNIIISFICSRLVDNRILKLSLAPSTNAGKLNESYKKRKLHENVMYVHSRCTITKHYLYCCNVFHFFHVYFC